MRGDHPDQSACAQNKGRALHGSDSRPHIGAQFVASGDEIAISYITDDDSPAGAQSLATSSRCSEAHPFPALGRFFAKPTMAQQPEFSVATFAAEDLHARKVSMQNRPRCIEDLVVQFSCPTRSYQLRCDVLKALCSVKLRLQPLLVLSQRLIIGFERPCSLL